jgi:arylsulfatase A-like enzyme
VKLLKGKKIAKRDLFWHYPHYGNQGGEPSAIIRSGNWKLIHYYEDGRDELYNLSKDIGETNDLAEINASKTKELSRKLNAWLKETSAKIPVADKRFDPEKKKKQITLAKTNELENKERYYREVQKPDWKAKNNWWGSGVAND